MLRITSGATLTESGWSSADVLISGAGVIAGESCASSATLDASGLLVLPGIVDIHGDAFERQIMPRPGVIFDLRTALLETDRQLAANGVTTAYHGVTCSWEPGLRSIETSRSFLRALTDLRRDLKVDTRFHLRHETFNLEAEAEVRAWLEAGLVHALAFNDHMRGILRGGGVKASKIAGMVERSGLGRDDFLSLVERVAGRESDVPASIVRLAGVARACGVPLLSHDDRNLEDRAFYRGQGCRISEFPMSEEVAAEARSAGEATVFGAPNVLRGGSHIGCPGAEDMASRGLCSILASDYYYPSLLAAPFLLAAGGACEMAQAWDMVSRNPARALGLDDRGVIASGKRADLILVESAVDGPKLVASIIGGEIAVISDCSRLGLRRAA